VLRGLEQHPLEIQTVRRLDLGALGDRHARCVQPLGELVADPLELPQIEDVWIRATVPSAARQSAHRERGDERDGQLALEPRDLRAQGPSRRELVTLDYCRFERRNGQRLYRVHLLLQEIHRVPPKRKLKITTASTGPRAELARGEHLGRDP
jgi:hypothetical protein